MVLSFQGEMDLLIDLCLVFGDTYSRLLGTQPVLTLSENGRYTQFWRMW